MQVHQDIYFGTLTICCKHATYLLKHNSKVSIPRL